MSAMVHTRFLMLSPTSTMLLRSASASTSEMTDYRAMIIKAKYLQNSNIIQTVLSNIKVQNHYFNFGNKPYLGKEYFCVHTQRCAGMSPS